MSVSLPNNAAGANVSGVSSAVVAVSEFATGVSLTGVTLMVAVLGIVSNAPLESCTENVKLA